MLSLCGHIDGFSNRLASSFNRILKHRTTDAVCLDRRSSSLTSRIFNLLQQEQLTTSDSAGLLLTLCALHTCLLTYLLFHTRYSCRGAEWRLKMQDLENDGPNRGFPAPRFCPSFSRYCIFPDFDLFGPSFPVL